jgi:hypothetical protein
VNKDSARLSLVLPRRGLGRNSALEKASLVAKLKAARDRKRARDGKCEGRRSHKELNSEAVALAKRLRRRNPKTGERKSLRQISIQLARLGHLNIHGRPFAAESIQAMLRPN